MTFERIATATNSQDIYDLVARLAAGGWNGVYASFVDSHGEGGGYPIRRPRWFEQDDLAQSWLPFPEMTPWRITVCHLRGMGSYRFKVKRDSFTVRSYVVESDPSEQVNQPFGHLVALEVHQKVLTPTATFDIPASGDFRDRIARLARAYGTTAQQLNQWATAVAPPAPGSGRTSGGPAARRPGLTLARLSTTVRPSSLNL